MTPVEIETAARSVVYDYLNIRVDTLSILESDNVPDDVSDEELEEIIEQIRQRLYALSSTNDDMEYMS